MAHKHSQSRLAHSGEIRQPSSTARIAGSLASFWTASDVTVAVRWKASDVTAAVRSASTPRAAAAVCAPNPAPVPTGSPRASARLRPHEAVSSDSSARSAPRTVS